MNPQRFFFKTLVLISWILAVSSQAFVQAQESITLVESWPLETTLDHPNIPDAGPTWLAMIQSAQSSIDMAEFYGHNQKNTQLDAVLQALEQRAKAGVKVRCIFDAKFYKFNREVPDYLKTIPNIDVQIIDLKDTMGGVQHIKYFIVDRKMAYLGSQNLDWRSLEHIQELGIQIAEPHVVRALLDIFEIDWHLATQQLDVAKTMVNAKSYDFPVQIQYHGHASKLWFLASPDHWLPSQSLWDLPQLLKVLNQAQKRIRVQVLNFSHFNYDHSTFYDLENALKTAAARGVQVQLLVSNWSAKPKYIEQMKALEKIPNITVKMATIPPYSKGFIPFARVIHSKYMTVDGEWGWVGTSNWAGDYFHASRNAGILIQGQAFTDDLDQFFETLWNSKYVEEIDAQKTYEVPRIRN